MASEFNWEDHPIENTSPKSEKKTDKGFDWNDHPVEAHANSPEAISAKRAALIGAGQGATMGFGEELTAPISAAVHDPSAALGTLKGLGKEIMPGMESNPEEQARLLKFQKLMQTYRDVAREEQQAAQEQHPVAYGAGALAGGALSTPLIPGLGTATSAIGKGAATAAEAVGNGALGTVASTTVKAAGGAGIGAGLGALSGAGEAQGSLEERLPGAEQGAEMGALVGGALPIAGQALKTTGKGIASAANAVGKIPVVQDTIENLTRGLKGQNLITSEGRRAASDAVRNASGDLAKSLINLKDKVGKSIGSAIKGSTEAGDTIDLTSEVKDTLSNLTEMSKSGSKDQAAYANGLKSEIQKVLGLKTENITDGINPDNMPEGLILPKIEELPKDIIVTPEKAQELKQVLSDYKPTKGMSPLTLNPARSASKLNTQTGEKLSETVEGLADTEHPQENKTELGLNSQYGLLKDAMKRLKINEKLLPEETKAKVFSILSNLDKENLTGDQAREQISNVLNNVKEVDPAIASKFEQALPEIVKPLSLASRNLRGNEAHGLIGTTRAIATSTGNAIGLAGNKLGLSNAPEVASAVGNAVKNTASFTTDILSSSKALPAEIALNNESQSSKIRSAEPYKLQKQVADATSKADPETLKQQAQNIKTKYGAQGEQLSNVLNNMANMPQDKRQSLMFMLMQNPAHRKMMGLMDKEEESK